MDTEMNMGFAVGSGRDDQPLRPAWRLFPLGKMRAWASDRRERRERTLQRAMGRTPPWTAHEDPLRRVPSEPEFILGDDADADAIKGDAPATLSLLFSGRDTSGSSTLRTEQGFYPPRLLGCSAALD